MSVFINGGIRLKSIRLKKRLLSIFTAAVLVFSSLTAAHCDDDITVLLDGQEIEFDVPPMIIDDRALVPMRVIFEALGATVDWDGETGLITAFKDTVNDGFKIIQMVIDNSEISVDTGSYGAKKITLDVPPMIIDDRTLVPIRAVSESLDCSVDWNSETRTVTIASPQIEPAQTNSPSAEETIAPETATAADIPIEYDDTIERAAHYMRDFQILACETNAEGDYVITYKLRTFLEGKGVVAVTFNCLDKDGNTVDSFGGMYVGTDYTWSWQEDTAVISGKTARIELAKNEE